MGKKEESESNLNYDSAMKKSVILYTLLCLLLFNSIAYCYDAERAKVNLASDFAECAAFYAVTVEGLRRTDVVTTKAEESFDVAYDWAVEISNPEVTQARINLSIDEQKELMKHDFSNFAILIEKYAKFCKELLENPELRLQFWLDNRN